MNKKKKIPKALFGLIIIIIIVIWFLNLKNIWPQIGKKDELIPAIKSTILDIDQSFQNLKKNLEYNKLQDSSEILTKEELQQLKEKILRENAKKEIIQ
ncbi:hypothetical protein IID20_02150 [Patescibacteria group bacterium]|nr:hypothetical protein [Patescibacteria group bacterium]